jgi:hypothetical protein
VIVLKISQCFDLNFHVMTRETNFEANIDHLLVFYFEITMRKMEVCNYLEFNKYQILFHMRIICNKSIV